MRTLTPIKLEDITPGMRITFKCGKKNIEGTVRKNNNDEELYVWENDDIKNGVHYVEDHSDFQLMQTDSDQARETEQNLFDEIEEGMRIRIKGFTKPMTVREKHAAGILGGNEIYVDPVLTITEYRLRDYLPILKGFDHDNALIIQVKNIEEIIREPKLPKITQGKPTAFYTQKEGILVVYSGAAKNYPWVVFDPEMKNCLHYNEKELLQKTWLLPLIPATKAEAAK
jgi:hypothetical protein